MDKEQVIEKLEEVFTSSCDKFLSSKSSQIDANALQEINHLGQALINAKRNVVKDVEKAEAFIKMKVDQLNGLDVKLIAKELYRLQSEGGTRGKGSD